MKKKSPTAAHTETIARTLAQQESILISTEFSQSMQKYREEDKRKAILTHTLVDQQLVSINEIVGAHCPIIKQHPFPLGTTTRFVNQTVAALWITRFPHLLNTFKTFMIIDHEVKWTEQDNSVFTFQLPS